MNKNIYLATIEEVLLDFPDLHAEVAVSCGDEVLYHEKFARSDEPWSVEKNSQYPICSITKQFTAAALLKSLYDRAATSCEEGIDSDSLKILVENDLQKPLSFFLSHDHEVWNGNMPNWANEVTLHHLLTHTSGIQGESITDFEQKYTPGENHVYSNSGYYLIGKVISEITKEPLDRYFKRVLFDPADMQSAYFPLHGTLQDLKQKDNFKNLALGFICDICTEEASFGSAEVNFHELDTAAAIVSTADDLIKWNNFLYQGKIIPKLILDLMTTKHISCKFYDDTDMWYGYGLVMYSEDQKMVYFHGGAYPGYQAMLSYIPDCNLSIVYLSNTSVDYASIMKKILDEHKCDTEAAIAIFKQRFPNAMTSYSFSRELVSRILMKNIKTN